MKILIEAHHPAHIHFWKYPIRELQARGHEVRMVGRDRDVMRRLLEAYYWIPSIIPKRNSQSNRFPLLEMLQRQAVVACEILKFKPDVVGSLMGSYTQSARLLGVRNIIFTDTETQAFNHRIAHPFAHKIYTPRCFLKDFGSKHVRYDGLHELSFLGGGNFMPDTSVLAKYGSLKPKEYLIIRMSAWNTFHDRDRKGIGDAIYEFLEFAKSRWQIVLSAEEGKIPPGLEEYALQFAPEDFHQILAHARFVLTEGASTASEAACVGVPAVFINSVGKLGYLKLLSEEFSLIQVFANAESGIPAAIDRLGENCENADAVFDRDYAHFLDYQTNVCETVLQALTGDERGSTQG